MESLDREVEDSMLFYEKRANGLAVRLTGELDHSAARDLGSRLDALIDETGAKRLMMDLSGVDFMDSSGIGLVIGRYKRLKRRGGGVTLTGTNARVDRIFDMAGVYQLVDRGERRRG